MTQERAADFGGDLASRHSEQFVIGRDLDAY